MGLKGTYYAKALPSHSGLQESKSKGTPHVFVLFEIAEGENKGQRVGWEGWLTPDSQERTFESLTYCGWDGKSLKDLSTIGANVVPIVVEEEKYTVDKKDDKGVVVGKEERFKSRVNWVNDPARGESIHKPMDEAAASAFDDRMQDSLAKWREKKGKPQPAHDAGSFDFGANAPPGTDGAAPPAEPTKVEPTEEAKAPNPATGY